MELKVYNTLGKKNQLFLPLSKDRVTMYYCGPTVYWTQHIGNLRGATCVDVIVRSIGYLGYQLEWVRNYTDVGHLTSDGDTGEDKMSKAALREKLEPLAIANKYIELYEQDTAALNLLEPTHKTRATEFIGEMIEMVQVLLDKGYAYVTPQAIYFDVTKVDNYTQLSGQKLDQNRQGEGSGSVSDADKHNAADFAVWFFRAGVHEKAIQFWPSPFNSPLVKNGEGFPGWHIECSAMSKKYLGSTLDIHMGGIEHVSVHHTNEIAQSEAVNGVKYVNYWLHNEHLLVNGGKMSKSAGTSFCLADITAKGYSPLVLRYLFLQAHYRSKLNFTWEALEAAKSGLDSIYRQIKALGEAVGLIDLDFQEEFSACLADDFNTPKALSVLQSVLKSDLMDQDKLALILDFDRVLGLDFEKILSLDEQLPPEILVLRKKRDEARLKKDWSASDSLRQQIEEQGYVVEDTKAGTKVYKK
ncbi:MAG: cysteine--tRNA ligase [bacterium]